MKPELKTPALGEEFEGGRFGGILLINGIRGRGDASFCTGEGTL